MVKNKIEKDLYIDDILFYSLDEDEIPPLEDEYFEDILKEELDIYNSIYKQRYNKDNY